MIEKDFARPVLGATPLAGGGWNFAVWGPRHERLELHLLGNRPEVLPMHRDALGYHTVVADTARSGGKYLYRFGDSHQRPDPASRRQPDGVHGPSELVDLQDFEWTDGNWKGVALENSVFYELHVGAFTQKGTFDEVRAAVDQLATVGVTTIELMPIAQFPGNRNWGYDGVYPFAVQNSYGTPRDLQRLVNAAHSRGLAVALDVVYNHLGPEGNYLGEYGPYFTDYYRTPWGAALNFDGPDSDEVRHFFIQNALYWLENFHIDALRLDAIHGIFDASAIPFLAELSREVEASAARTGKIISLVAESDLNDARVLRCRCEGGLGMRSQWSDDFHHSVHTLLTGENSGYYEDFGDIQHLGGTLQQGWYYAGQYSRHRRRRHGNRPPPFKGSNYTVCIQNHDQVGNRALGERLSSLVNLESLKLAAGANLLSPFVPLLFMGEEYGETSPFLYFTSHGDPNLAEAVRRGRAEEFRSFSWQDQIPDPQAESTFDRSRLKRDLAEEEPHRTILRFYQMLLRFRSEYHLGQTSAPSIKEFEASKALLVLQDAQTHKLAMLFNFGDAAANLGSGILEDEWEKKIDSSDLQWLGPGSDLPSKLGSSTPSRLKLQPRSFAVFQRTGLPSES
ncbi:MAG: malto-oligosyltrehalose trehalohydrolase [Candidatus Acidoferrum typicum]|nr:malto-oligosyltrehalose trehalohydrolase [Candidatus Acidoferrum typicum]